MQKILIINVPRLFAPVWSVISYMLPEHHKERIVLLTTAKTSTEELKKARPLAASALLRWRGRVRPPKSHATRARQYMPEEHIPPHVKNGG